MDEDHRELLRRLFAAATELTETAHEAAIAGQSKALAAQLRSLSPKSMGGPRARRGVPSTG